MTTTKLTMQFDRLIAGHYTKDEAVEHILAGAESAKRGHTIPYADHRSRIKEPYGLLI